MTIKDLARLSGYSVGTVSRALNGLPNVSEQARSAILALAQERGYQLNTNAKYLKQIHSSGIVAVVTGTSNELFAQMIERIQQMLPTDRYPLTVDYVDENEDPVERALHLSREKKPAGLLFLGGDRRMYAKSFGEITLPSVVLTTCLPALRADARRRPPRLRQSLLRDHGRRGGGGMRHGIPAGKRPPAHRRHRGRPELLRPVAAAL